MNIIGERLRSERERLGLSLPEFAELGGVQRNAQFKYEKGERMPDAAYLMALVKNGVDVVYLFSGHQSTAACALTDEEQKVLRERGICFEEGASQAEVEISPLGLLWLLNLYQSVGTGELMRWGAALLSRVAQFQPVHMRGLNLQAVRLQPYGGKHYSHLIIYLDETPPSTPWSLSPSAGLKGRYELDVEAHSLPVMLPDDGYLPPVLVLPEGDLAALQDGAVVRYQSDSASES